MRSVFARLAYIVTLCAAFAMIAMLWGCDVAALPTPTPIEPSPTPIPTPSATPVATSTPTATLAATATSTATPTTTPTTLPSSTPTLAPTEEPPTPAPKPTRPAPQPTATVDPGQPTATPRVPRPTFTTDPGFESTPRPAPPTPVQNEPPPKGGWSEVVRVAPGNRRIALTFDAGGAGEALPQILNTLRQRGLHVTMFFTGKFAEQYPDGLRQAVADGHEIANHTYSHLDSTTLTDDQLANELARTETIIRGLTGASTKPYWRPPFGARNNHVLNVAVSQGYRSIYWTLDSLDSVGEPKTPDFIFNRITNPPNGLNLDGAIVLQHFGSQASADALPRILDRLQEMGLQVVTVSELIAP